MEAARAKSQEPGAKSHLLLTLVLLAGIAVTLYIGMTGSFTLFNAKGLLSGPFSFLLLLGATEAAALLLVVLDWRVWKPRGRARAAAIERWLNVDVLGNREAPAANWDALHGSFRGRTVTLRRNTERRGMGMETWRWSAATAFKGTFRAVRTALPAESKKPNTPERSAYDTGDAEFEERYQWQSDRPAEVVKLLRQPELRGAVKRLASLFALHGAITDANCGIQLERGELVLSQAPAPVFTRSTFSPQELLLILHDLTLVAAVVEGTAPPTPEVLATPDASAAGSPLLAFGCAGVVALAVWLGGTYGVARFIGLPAAMVAFFMPAVALALWFIAVSTLASGRNPEVEAAIETESRREIDCHADLRLLAKGVEDKDLT